MTEQRKTNGTVGDRSNKPPLEVKIRYFLAMTALLIVAAAAGWAASKASESVHQSAQAKQQAQDNAVLTKKVAVLSAANTAVLTRVVADETETCLIQKRGLPASHYLASAMGDISALLSYGSAHPSTPVPPQVAKPLADLKRKSGLYAAIQASQPNTRSCP